MTERTDAAQRPNAAFSLTPDLLERVLSTFDDVILVTEAEPLDEPGPRVVYVNKAFAAMTGWADADILGRSPRMLQGPETDRATLKRVRSAMRSGSPVQAELVNYRRDGSPFWVEMIISPLLDDDGAVTHFVAVQRDSTLRKRGEFAMERRLRRSDLTGLLNRDAFVAAIEARLAAEANSATPAAVILFDLQGLHNINHVLGRDSGDELLVETARRLDRISDGLAEVAHVSGGEFGFLVCDARVTPSSRCASGCGGRS